MATWPDTLQENLNTGDFAEAAQPTSIRTNMDAGPDKVRNRYSTPIYQVNGSIWVDENDKQVLDNFWRWTTFNGSLQFDMLDPATRVKYQWRFLAPPAYTAISGIFFRAQLSFERLP